MISEREENDALAEAQRKLTYGQKAVGLTFNPSGDPKVHQLKELFAAIIDICRETQLQSGSNCNETWRLGAIAITQAQQAQMWCVKACTWVD